MAYEQQPVESLQTQVETGSMAVPEVEFPKKWSVLRGSYNLPDATRLVNIEKLPYPDRFYTVTLYAFELSELVKPEPALDARFAVLGRQATFSMLPEESAAEVVQELSEASNDDLILEIIKGRLKESAAFANQIRNDYDARQKLKHLTDPYERHGKNQELITLLKTVDAMRRKEMIGPITLWGSSDVIRLEIAREKGLHIDWPSPNLRSVE